MKVNPVGNAPYQSYNIELNAGPQGIFEFKSPLQSGFIQFDQLNRQQRRISGFPDEFIKQTTNIFLTVQGTNAPAPYFPFASVVDRDTDGTYFDIKLSEAVPIGVGVFCNVAWFISELSAVNP
jgi:hypothetical protein